MIFFTPYVINIGLHRRRRAQIVIAKSLRLKDCAFNETKNLDKLIDSHMGAVSLRKWQVPRPALYKVKLVIVRGKKNPQLKLGTSVIFRVVEDSKNDFCN